MNKHLNFILLLLLITIVACSDSEDVNPLDSDKTPPSMEISFPGFPNLEEGATLISSQQLEIKIKAEDTHGINKVETFIDDQKISEDSEAPYVITIDFSDYSTGSSTENAYTLKVIATDNATNTTTKEQLIIVDNEIPSINEVTLHNDMVLHGDTNTITFDVSDNEGIDLIKVYLNDDLLTEMKEEDPLEVNINTSPLDDGQNTLKIEAIDIVGNKTFYEVNFISDNTGPEIKLESITNDMLIDELLTINPIVEDVYSEVSSVIIKYNDDVLFSTNTSSDINYQFDPESVDVGDATLTIEASDSFNNTSVKEIPVKICRRLITINIPENKIHEAITHPIVFISRMDGSLLCWKEILREDRQIILNTPEEFDQQTEFMLSFYLQDNGDMVGISTHQNLTRSNPQILNLSEPIRLEGSAGIKEQIPTSNFLSNDIFIGQSANSSGKYRSLNNATAYYNTYLNNSESYLSINTAVTINKPNEFDSYYLYETSSYKYFFINAPIDQNYVLDKANLSDQNLVSNELVVHSQNTMSNPGLHLSIIGASSKDDDKNDKFHTIFHSNRNAISDKPMQYYLNSSFYSYRHVLWFGDYFTERRGAPESNYQIPNLSLDYTFSNNQLNLSIQGNEHVVGRARCTDFDNLTYNWNITFNSNGSNNIIVPELPPSISHPVATAHSNGNIKVETVEIISYDSILTYAEYLQKVVKNQTNILDATNWYQLIYKSNRPEFYSPNKDFAF